jgi:phosphohistidine swiveling domain-containing protein
MIVVPEDSGPLLSYVEAAVAGPAIVGGKGWNLGRLARYGFTVPEGSVLVAGAYRQQLTDAQIGAHLAALANVPANAADAPETIAHLDAIRDAIVAAPLPTSVSDAVCDFLDRAGLGERPIAVRSSATVEDGAEASFAGIHESVLSVVGLDAALDAIRWCYASLWTPRAFAYRRRLGLEDDAVACAVVLCAMVGRRGEPQTAPVAAGVAFSADPRTGRRDLMVVSAAPGLGEALVGGRVEPEEIELRIDERDLGVVARRGSTSGVLADDQALALARIVLRVHWALGEGQDPQDVEWVYDGERFWLVQARPVTRLPHVTPEPVRDLPVIWSNANLKDAVAGVPSTLGWSIIQRVLRSILYTHLQTTGYQVPNGMETVRRLAGRAYFDLTAMHWLMYDGLGFTPAEINVSMGGMQPETPVPGDPFVGLVGKRRKLARVRLLKQLWQSARVYDAEIARVRALVHARTRDDISGLSNVEIIAWRSRTNDTAMAFSRLFALNNAGSLWDKLLTDLIDNVRPGDGLRIASSLLAGTNAVVTAEHGYRLIDLARLAEAEPAARAYLETTPLDPWGWRSLPESSPFRGAFAELLDEFGHRGVYEVEIANRRWNEDPTYLLEQVRTFLDLHEGVRGRDHAAARRQAAEREARSLPFWIRPLVSWLAARARRAAALREAGKSALVSTLQITRMMTSELGERMVAAGLLDRPDEIFHLAWWDIAAWAEGDWDGTGARALVADRAAQRAGWLALEPPDVIVHDTEGRLTELPAKTAMSWPSRPDTGRDRRRQLHDRLLVGAGVSSGRARGPARVIRHPSESARLQPGDVLVAPSTDPGWTPLFLRASAVVMEVGGYLSHGAIVAREYGLPAVVNVSGALTAIHDGEMLEVDGDAGEVVVVR